MNRLQRSTLFQISGPVCHLACKLAIPPESSPKQLKVSTAESIVQLLGQYSNTTLVGWIGKHKHSVSY